LRFPQPHARAAAVLRDELDAGRFDGAPNYIKARSLGRRLFILEIAHRDDTDAGHASELVLSPGEEAPGGLRKFAEGSDQGRASLPLSKSTENMRILSGRAFFL
jgi:hypothetical protein